MKDDQQFIYRQTAKSLYSAGLFHYMHLNTKHLDMTFSMESFIASCYSSLIERL